jgi:hypothetical protein
MGSRLVGFVHAVVVVALVTSLLTFRSAPVEASVPAGPPPALPPQAAELEARINAGASGEPYEVTFSESDLDQLAAYGLAESPDIPFRDVRVTILDDHFLVDGVTTGTVIPVPVRAVVTLTADNGTPVVRVEDVSLGGIPLPESVRNRVRDDVNQSLDPSRLKLPLTLDSVAQQRGSVTLRGHIV